MSTMLLCNNGSGTSNRGPSVVIHNDSRRRRDEKNCASQAPRYETETKAHILHTFGPEHNIHAFSKPSKNKENILQTYIVQADICPRAG